MKTIEDQISTSLQAMQRAWGSYLALGIILCLAGCYAIFAAAKATGGALIAMAAVLIAAGLVQVVSAFAVLDTARSIFLALFVGVLDLLVGIVLLKDPAIEASTVGTYLAILFMFGGVYRFVVAGLLEFPEFGWFAFSGALSVILGALLWMQWPSSAQWFIGLAVGLNFIFAGIAWSALGWRLKAA